MSVSNMNPIALSSGVNRRVLLSRLALLRYRDRFFPSPRGGANVVFGTKRRLGNVRFSAAYGG